ncbi:MAG: hypothetical protein IJ808_03905 [Muribaculaceae bacterium]|nr:hypothetical protein [Muribaculaceae bacterium]
MQSSHTPNDYHHERLLATRTVNMNCLDIDPEGQPSLRHMVSTIGNAANPQKFAVIELSTKAVKLLVGRDTHAIIHAEQFDFDLFFRASHKTDTGRGLDRSNRMNVHYFTSRVLPHIIHFREVARQQNVDQIFTIATAAYRTATNRDEIISIIKREAGLNVCILTKQEEAQGALIAFRHSTPFPEEMEAHEHVIVVDQGGGSTEVGIYCHMQPQSTFSLNLGTEVLRTLLLCQHGSLELALQEVDQITLERFGRPQGTEGISADSPAYCIALGTAIGLATGRVSAPERHGVKLSVDDIYNQTDYAHHCLCDHFHTVDDLAHTLQTKRDEQLESLVSMRLGLPLYLCLMNYYRVPSLIVSGAGLWYGIYYNNLSKNDKFISTHESS